ncbi:MAG: hypothetical protein FP820_04680 [Sulfurimonas sp.]|nr:hypothetical protein [Sulfurimonas sp.]MBU3940159.1 hypothetical protein [bacterium]MBU4023542.1 hypothetical protein [bacterium]MBU4058748.1 hypothetical protein [bacterium]MBU4109746.1 hypothetical protein [bacterium]
MDNIVIEADDIVIIGFINSKSELEYTQYKAFDGGVVELDNIEKYTEEELTEILYTVNGLEIDDYI